MRTALERWVRFWDEREGAESLALVRIGVGAVVLWDLFWVARLGLIGALWAPIEEGGIGPASYAQPICTFYRVFGASSGSAYALFAIATLAALGVTLGRFSRTSALVLVFASGELAQLSPSADRGIDTLLRNVLLVLACSGAGACWSLDARGAPRQPDAPGGRLIPAWPRYLLIVQLVILYFTAGMLKQSAPWTSLGGYYALYKVLQQPHYARFALPHELLAALYPFLQLSTLLTVWFERLAFALPLLLWLRRTRARAGRVRAALNRARLLEIWIALGIMFHLALAFGMELGIFPWGCLAIYPALARPERVRNWYAAIAAGWSRRTGRREVGKTQI